MSIRPEPIGDERRGGKDITVSIGLGEESLTLLKSLGVPARAGRVMLWDLAKTSARPAAAGRTLCLSLPRELLSDLLAEQLDGLHVLALGEMATVFAEHLGLVLKHLPTAPAHAATGMVRATAELLAASILPRGGNGEMSRARVADLLLQRAKREAGRRLEEPTLSPESLALAVGVSRTTLYRLFEPLGGVGAYIRERRLIRAWQALSDPGETRRIGEIAYALGFRAEAQFSRAFRSRFAASPGEVRKLAGAASLPRAQRRGVG